MRRLKRFAQLNRGQRRILAWALLVVSVARVSLWLLPLNKSRRVVSLAAAGAASQSVEQVVWAVQAVSRYLPAATCLIRAIAAQALLNRSGFTSQLEVGVARHEKEPRRIQAHAWVICHGQVVLGGAEAEGYNSLTSWNPQE
ncbi:MAG TPA: lasso peptide biosynthesis B2 protein [Terriglobales bacterium]|jgi:hypothetical protein|nr:lasso peptide biosynthesis B2 protein [Terriglobales bacterium]